MLLRASGEVSGNAVDVSAITDDAAAQASGIAHAEALLAFAAAAARRDDAGLTAARARLLDETGAEALVGAAAVVGNFERMTRIADSTGIPLDTPTGSRDRLTGSGSRASDEPPMEQCEAAHPGLE